MGSDFVCSVCPLPDITEEIKDKISLRILELKEDTINSLLETYYYDWEEEVDDMIDERLKEDHLFELNEIRSIFKKEIAQELLRNAIEEVIYTDDRRDTAHMFLDHRWWIISGGMSWGDSPTEAMQYIDIIEESGVLKGLNHTSNE